MRQFVVLVAVFACRFSVCWIIRDACEREKVGEPEPVKYLVAKPIRVGTSDNAIKYTLIPYFYKTGDFTKTIAPRPEGKVVWFVEVGIRSTLAPRPIRKSPCLCSLFLLATDPLPLSLDPVTIDRARK